MLFISEAARKSDKILEPYAGKLARTVLRRGGGSNLSNLVDANGDFIAPDIPITNNTKVPVNITVQSLASSAGGTLQFTDVADETKDWANLNLADSKSYIALGINIKDALGWNTGYDEGTHYAIKTESTLFGSIPANATGTMTMEASFGLAFDQSYTAMHSLIFMFNLV